jgi:hypothetical protein
MIKDEQGIVGIMQWLKVLRLWKRNKFIQYLYKKEQLEIDIFELIETTEQGTLF